MRQLSLFQSLAISGYRFYLVAFLSQTASMSMQSLARGLLMYRLTGSVTLLGLLFLANALPELLLSLFGGVIADRMPKKLVMMAGQLGYFLTALFIALALSFNVLSPERDGSWIILVVVTAIRGVIQGLVAPSRIALVTDLVGRELVLNAISLRNMGRYILRFAIPGLAGWLIDTTGFATIYYSQAVFYLIAISATSRLPAGVDIRSVRHSVVSEMKHGLRYVAREKNLLVILIFALLAAILSMPYLQLMPVFVEDVLKVGATGMGILLSVSAAGAIAGSVLLAALPNRKRGLLFVVSGILLALSIVGFAFSEWWYASLALMVFIGLGNVVRSTLSNTLLQTYTSDAYRGRVMSLYSMELGLTSLGGFFAAILAGAIGVQFAVGGMALLLVLISVAALISRSRIVRLD